MGGGGESPGRWNIIGTPLFCFPPENQYRRSAAPLGGGGGSRRRQISVSGKSPTEGRATPVKLRTSQGARRVFHRPPSREDFGACISGLLPRPWCRGSRVKVGAERVLQRGWEELTCPDDPRVLRETSAVDGRTPAHARAHTLLHTRSPTRPLCFCVFVCTCVYVCAGVGDVTAPFAILREAGATTVNLSTRGTFDSCFEFPSLAFARNSPVQRTSSGNVRRTSISEICPVFCTVDTLKASGNVRSRTCVRALLFLSQSRERISR